MNKTRVADQSETAAWIHGLIQSNQLRKFYNSAQWLHLRAEVLEEQHHECQRCREKGRAAQAITVHHVQYVRRRPDLALTKSNLMAVCDQCHYEIHHGKPHRWVTEERW